ncbi:MAG: SDR family oxidoreductase [Magnetococcales bacterium]|nr:SDR family oxidoreductase [Magnetococcales bacterium]
MSELEQVLITGASRGIGAAVAEGFARLGHPLILTGRSEPALADRAAALHQAYGVAVDFRAFDVGDAAACKELFLSLGERAKNLGVLVNNAGVLHGGLLGMMAQAPLEEMVRTNFLGTFQMMQLATRFMMRRKAGCIINLTSIMGIEGAEGLSAYAATKSAVIGLTRSAAKELAPLNIRVNAVAPGFIATDMTEHLSAADREKRLNSIRMRRAGTPEEVAELILFLASEKARYISGQVIGVDGMMTL